MKLSISALYNGYDVCYKKNYIQKAEFIQKIIGGIIESTFCIADSLEIETPKKVEKKFN